MGADKFLSRSTGPWAARKEDAFVHRVRNLHERGFSPKNVRELFRLIDWVMELPPALAAVFRQDLDKIEE